MLSRETVTIILWLCKESYETPGAGVADDQIICLNGYGHEGHFRVHQPIASLFKVTELCG